MDVKVSIVIVNFNGWNVLRPCLESIYRESAEVSFEIIVVDNASTDDSVQCIEKEFPEVRLVRSASNIGFAAGNNRGFQIAAGEYVLMLNPDTVILKRAIANAADFLDEHPVAAIAGGRLFFADHSLQYSLSAFPSVWNMLCEALFLGKIFPHVPAFANFPLTHFDYGSARQVDAVCGAFLMFRKGLLDEIGQLDEQFFMYTEEVDFCYRAKLKGHEVWFTPRAEIIHYWGGISAINRRIVLWTVGSQMLFFQKHFHGAKKYTVMALKYLGVILRAGGYWSAGLLLHRTNLSVKASYFAYAASHVLSGSWRYRKGASGPFLPWSVP